jgi:hypothetical protein
MSGNFSVISSIFRAETARRASADALSQGNTPAFAELTRRSWRLSNNLVETFTLEEPGLKRPDPPPFRPWSLLLIGSKREFSSRIKYATAPIFLIGLWLLTLSFVPARQPSAVPTDLARLVERAAKAANTHDAAALAPFTVGEPKRLLPWLAETTTPKWEGSLLALPETPNHRSTIENRKSKIENPLRFLAVFHAWHTCESDGDHVHWLENTERGWRIGAEILETETGGFRVRDHDLHVRIEPTKKLATISDSVRIERLHTERPAFCLLRLSQDFRVTKVTRDTPEGEAVPFQQAGGVLLFTPPEEKKFTLSLKYAGVVNHRGSDYILNDEATLNSYWVPHIARLPATATVTATVPAHWTPLATGERILAKPATGATRTVTFRNDIPICYYTLTAGKYVLTTRTLRGKTLSAYMRTADSALATKSLDILERAMTFFERNFGPFPYSSYTLVETRGAFGGALESYSFATFGPFTMPGTVAHELAHTWWGGLIPCTYTRSMWNESFADYSDELFQRLTNATGRLQRPPPDVRLKALRRNATAYNAFPMTLAHDTSDGRQVAVGYGKGALVLRVLEEEIGLDTMLQSIREFLSSHKRGEAAEWPDFEAAVNKVAGKDYRWFFAQWAERTGMPAIRLANVEAWNTGNGIIVEADIVQSGTPYRLKVPVLLETSSGADVRDTVIAQGARTRFRLRASSLPTQLVLDPEGILPLAQSPDTPDDTDRTLFTFASGEK